MLNKMSFASSADKADAQFLVSLVNKGIIDQSAATRVHKAHEKTLEPYCRLLTALGVVEETKLAEQLAGFVGRPLLGDAEVPEVALDCGMSENFLREESILPLALLPDGIVVATADPFSEYAREAISLATQRRVDIVIGELSRIQRAIEFLYQERANVQASSREMQELEEADSDIQRLRDQAAEEPVIRLVNQIIQSAVEMGASDIHLEPFLHQFQVRYRIDGILRDVSAPAAQLRNAIASRIKVMARLDIAERRLPQDGRMRVTVKGKDVDLRISTFPTMYGESVVLRILDRSGVSVRLNQLGFSPNDLGRYSSVLNRPMGMILVTGPTGSGKTTTLYASLLELDRTVQKIFTVEDPIEYEIARVNQTQVKPEIGLTFAKSLRSLMRQDPDVMLIGEIRDLETAEIASQSALTGHKVLTTLHTNDAVSAVTRLRDMGMPAFLITATLNCVMAQRLVRVLCPSCKIYLPPDARLIDAAAKANLDAALFEKTFGASGCVECNQTGYRGRTGIYEVFLLSEETQALIQRDGSVSDLKGVALREGMSPMAADGLRKVALGLTTVDEVHRVVGI